MHWQPQGVSPDVARTGRFRCGRVGLGVLRQGEDCKRQYGGLRPSLLLFWEQMWLGSVGPGMAQCGSPEHGSARLGKLRQGLRGAGLINFRPALSCNYELI